MVANFRRILKRGGTFLYPQNSCTGSAHLRLMYEANPVSFLIEQAGGAATDGVIRILDIMPAGLLQHVVLIFGDPHEVRAVDEAAASSNKTTTWQDGAKLGMSDGAPTLAESES